MTSLAPLLDELKERFIQLHGTKEDLFWVTKMGLAEDPAAERRRMAAAEIAYNQFLQDPQRLRDLRRRAQDTTVPADQRRILEGWIATFAANAIEDPEARRLSEEIVELEGDLERRRQGMRLGFVDPASGVFTSASSVQLALMLRSDPDEGRRRAAHEGLRSIETFVLEQGFLDIVKRRNRLARMLGYPDFYAWRVAVVEHMDKARLFTVLDELAANTAERSRAELAELARRHGEQALEPWNYPFLRAGEITRKLDPYFRLGASLERWVRAFHSLGIRYRGATLTLDLLDRPGKYENGFMHGPGVAFYDHGHWRPARINFTANAVMGQPGSGLRATETLFHEGGHAAHFANIQSDAPCFAHEFAPTSVAYAETQSMFLDSLLSDAAWRTRYATDAQGTTMPMELVEEAIREQQPFSSWDVRGMLTVPFAERALYEMADDDLVPERVLDTMRTIERELQGLTAGVRPVLAVPHLLAGESSAYYHGYVLADMAVHQTRDFFLRRDGHLVDNPSIGPELAEHYWKPGNAVGFDDTLRSLTGSPLRPDALVAACNRSVDEAIADARRDVDRMRSVPTAPPLERATLDATVRVMHGRETIAHGHDGTFAEACEAFASWVGTLEAS
jgi:Zn-dependent oligopeptidase